VERFCPTLLAHAIAAQTQATPKQWQEPNHTTTIMFYYYFYLNE
jgi:hypothetical protein